MLMFLELVLRWVHILSAITLVGGTIFMKYALLPGLKSLEAEQRETVAASIRGFWSKCVMATSGLLLISGFVNLFRIMKIYGTNFDGPYHAMVGIKMLLAFAIFALASILSGRSSNAQKLRQKESMWLNVNIGLAIAVVCIAGYMKSMDRTPKDAAESEDAVSLTIEMDLDQYSNDLNA
ncbi:hypothetical protein ACFL2H_04955 [Planctomycetota bacterium]